QILAAFVDIQNNVRKLVDIESNTLVCNYEFSAFGEKTEYSQENVFNPWQFASKRFDPELSLIDFGKRYYIPNSGRWLTTDPAGFVDNINLY
ncbi:MAG: RHS repeat-associated core domain-containing protein, partial [Parachlamydiaceae bacterium]|nr:RHS repeat-associated core domain-containing protein [Parachlamydiaceae bacterium]